MDFIYYRYFNNKFFLLIICQINYLLCEIAEEMKFEPITVEALRQEKGYQKVARKQQKELDSLKKRQQKEKITVQKQQCAAIEKLIKGKK